MARRKSRFIIGLFVSAGFVLGVAAIVWLGASNYFEQGELFVTYFDESVQGLQVDSRVKYRGVDVGKVQSINVAPDQKLVEVVIKIDMEGEVEKFTCTQLRSAGITGIVFIELDQRTPKDEVLLPPAKIKPPHPAIPSKTSQGLQMLKSVDRIIDRVEQVDLKGISDQIKQTGKAMESLFSGPATTKTMAHLESTTGHLDRSLGRIDAILAEKGWTGILDDTHRGVNETRAGIAEARRLVADLKAEVASLKTGELSDKAVAILEALDQRTRLMSLELAETTDDIRQAVDSLKELIDRLQKNPSDLLFSRPLTDDTRKEGR